MLIAAAAAVLCLAVLPTMLHHSTRFDHRPRVGLVVWGSLYVMGWTSAVAFFLELGLGGSRRPLLTTVLAFVHRLDDGHPLRGLGLTEVVGLSIAFDITVLLLGGLVLSTWKVVNQRFEQRTVLDLVAEPAGAGVCLLEHAQPLAYFLPGHGGRVVLSTGAVDALSSHELSAVVAHELGHRHGRHGAFLIPLQALSSFVSFLPLAHYAPTVMRSYLEMTADDFARARGYTEALRDVLAKASLFERPPLGAFGALDGVVARRIGRLSSRPTPALDASLLVVVLSSCLSLLYALSMSR